MQVRSKAAAMDDEEASRLARSRFRRSPSGASLGSISEIPVEPPRHTAAIPSNGNDDDDDDEDEEIEFPIRPLQRKDRSFLNNSARGSPTGSKRGRRTLSLSDHGSTSASSSIRSFDESKRERSLLTPNLVDREEDADDAASMEPASSVSSSKKNKRDSKGPRDDFAHLLDHLIVVPKRSHSMVDQIRRKDSSSCNSGSGGSSNKKDAGESVTKPSRRSRSFVESSSNLRKQWFQKSKSQVQAMLRSSSSNSNKTPPELEKRPSLTPKRDSRILTRTPSRQPRSIMRAITASSASSVSSCSSTVASSPSASSKQSVTLENCSSSRGDLSTSSDRGNCADDDDDEEIEPIKPRSDGNLFSKPKKKSDFFSCSKPRSFAGHRPPSTKKGKKTKDMREEMKRFLQNEGSIKEEEDEDFVDEEGEEDDGSVYDSGLGGGNSVDDSGRFSQPRRILSRIQSITKSESSESANSGSQRDSGPSRSLSRVPSIAKSDSTDSTISSSQRDSGPRRALSRTQSIVRPDSNDNNSTSSRRRRRERSVDKAGAAPAAGNMRTPTTSNRRKKAVRPSPAKQPRPSLKIQSGTSCSPSISSSCDISVSDAGSVSSASNQSLRQRLPKMMRSSPSAKRQSSKVSVDMAGSVRGKPRPPSQPPLTHTHVEASSPSSLFRRISFSRNGGDKRRSSASDLPLVPALNVSNDAFFDEAFYSSSHHRRTIATRHLTWTTDRNDNFSDWILLIVRGGVSWETSNVDAYHIHKSIVGVGLRPSFFLLDQFEDQDSVYVRNTSSVELLSPAADLVPAMLDYIYDLKTHPLQISTGNATALRYLADKFGVESMFQEVSEFIRGDLKESTVDTYASDAAIFKDKQLMQAAFRLQKSLDTFD